MLLAYSPFIALLLFQAVSRAHALGSIRIALHGLTAMAFIVLRPRSSMLTSISALSVWLHPLPFTDTNLPHALGTVGSIVVAALSCFFQSPCDRTFLHSRQALSLPTSTV